MAKQTFKTELSEFVAFAIQRLHSGSRDSSIEEIFRQWREARDFSTTVADVPQGLVDAAGSSEGNRRRPS